MALSNTAKAQATSHAYISVGVGATAVNGGGEWLIKNGPIGIGGEFGVGVGDAFLVTSLTVAYHPLARKPSKIDPFVAASYTAVGNVSYAADLLTVGGGVTCWPRKPVGLRLDGFTSVSRLTDSGPDRRYWALRAGAAFRVGH
jgi:hypothetical protein